MSAAGATVPNPRLNTPDQEHSTPILRATLLGPFSITMGTARAGPWQRPPAKRVCELVLVSSGRRIAREILMEALWPNAGATAAARALTQALSYARAAIGALGAESGGLLQADRSQIWAYGPDRLEIDLDAHEEVLRTALATEPGPERDRLLAQALQDDRMLLADEPYADWALQRREHLEQARQEARLALARDRARGVGRSDRHAVVQAWEACFERDTTNEEVACALVRLYKAQARHGQALTTYERCKAGLVELGVRTSPALEEAYREATSPLPAFSPVTGSAGREPPATEERRIVTVLFAQLDAALGAGPRLGDEERRDLIGAALAGVIGHVEDLGGTITSVSGVGLVAIFGAPQSHEDDPERALRAALRAVREISARVADVRLQVGVETGAAIVGPLFGRSHYGAFGDVVGVAAALQAAAKPAAVLVGPVTFAAAKAVFEWGQTEELVAGPGHKTFVAHYVERTRSRPGIDVDRRRLSNSIPLVGRDAELAVVREAVNECTSGRGSVLLVVGEAGLGKTRLVAECRKIFMAWAGARSGRLPLWLEGGAASYASSDPYGLYRQLLCAWVGVAPEEDEKIVRAALMRAMRAIWAGEPDMDQFELVCGLMVSSRAIAGASKFSPEQFRRATFTVLRELVGRLLSYGPTVVVLEDLHWSDPTSLDVTRELATLAEFGPLLVVATRRPEPDPGVSAMELALGSLDSLALRFIELRPLDKGTERQLARALLGDAWNDEVEDAVVCGTDGNPFFLEQRVDSFRESAALPTGSQEGREEPVARTNLPEAVERLVRSRLDRLAPEPRQAIVAASVFGPEFSAKNVVAICDLEDVTMALKELCSAGLIVEVREGAQTNFRFRHALVQEATYKGMLASQRRHLHGRAAWVLEESSAGRLDEVAALLGHHFALAGEGGRAASYLERAGDRAVIAYANDEAASSYRYAVELLGAASETAPATKARLWLKLGDVYVNRARSEEAVECLRQAAALADSAGQQDLWAEAEVRLALVEFEAGQAERAVERLVVGRETLGGPRPTAALAKVTGRLASLLSLVGRADEALAAAKDALQLAEQLELPEVACQALNARGCALMFRARLGEAESALRAAVGTAETHDLTPLALTSMNNLCDALEANDRWGEVLVLRDRELALSRRAGNRRMELRSLVTRIPVLYRSGLWDEAIAAAKAADGEELRSSSHVALHLVALVPVLVGRGETSAAAELMRGVAKPAEPNAEDLADLALAQAELLISQGEPSLGFSVLEPALDLRAELGLANTYYKRVLVKAIEAALASGDLDGAERLLGTIGAAPKREVTPWLRAQVALLSANTAFMRGSLDIPGAGYAKAEEGLRHLGAAFDLAVAQLQHAEWLMARHEEAKSGRLSQAAAKVFARLGARPWSARARHLCLAM